MKILPRLEYCFCPGNYVTCLKCPCKIGKVIKVLDDNFYEISWCEDPLFNYVVHRTNLSLLEIDLLWLNEV